jgi:hypothetical protein
MDDKDKQASASETARPGRQFGGPGASAQTPSDLRQSLEAAA